MTGVKHTWGPGQSPTTKPWSQPKEAVLVQIRLDRGSVLKDSDLRTDDRRFSQATHEKGKPMQAKQN